MGKEQTGKARRDSVEDSISNPKSTRRRARRKAAAAPPMHLAVLHDDAGASVAAGDWRFHLAALLRISEHIVSAAVTLYERVFGLDKREENEIYLEMGKKLAGSEKFDEALRALRRVVRAKPNHKEALFHLGLIHLRRKAPLAAIEMLRKASDAGMKSHDLHLHLADALDREGRYTEALKELDGALTFEPKVADTHYRKAMLLDRLERYPESVESLEVAVRLAPRDARYHQGLGFALETVGRRGAAIKCFKRALELERARELENLSTFE